MRLITKDSRNLQTECSDTPVGQLDEEELPTSASMTLQARGGTKTRRTIF